MKKDKYEDYITQSHIDILTIQELINETTDVTKFFGYPVLSCLDEVSQKFKIIYNMFNESTELMLNCHARNEYEEAALHDLRHVMEILYYQIKQDFPGNDIFEHGALCDGMKTLISIFIHLPNIMHGREKNEIFDYALTRHLLKSA